MFYLKLLGGATLEGDDGPVGGRAAHPRPFAVLAAIAAAPSPVGREWLVGLFWPDRTGAAARHLLAETLHQLRRELGKEAIEAVGDTVAVNPGRVQCDAAEFARAVAEGELERAVDLYGGPLLRGFYVKDAREFSLWCEQERARLEGAYVATLEELAGKAEVDGDLPRAVELRRRAVAVDPCRAPAVLRLMLALEAAGDPAGALRAAGEHVRRLRAELEIPPTAELLEAIARLRARSEAMREQAAALGLDHLGSAPPPPVAGQPEGGTGGDPSDVERETGEGEYLPGRREPRPARWGGSARGRWLQAGGILLAAGLAFLLLMRGYSGANNLDPSTYVVLPFAHRAGAGTGLTPDQCELLLREALAGWSDLRLVDAQRTRDLVLRRGRPTSLREAKRIARELGAGKLLWGEVAVVAGSVHVQGALYDLRSGTLVAERAIRVARDLHDLGPRFAELALALLSSTSRSGAPVGAPLGTSKLAAWHAYDRAQAAMSLWDLDGARRELEEAVRIDPGYAAAHLWRAQAMSWGGEEPAGWRESAALAVAEKARLARREQKLAEALLALAEERYDDACRTYGELVARDSADFAAWFGIGECNTRDPQVVPDPRSPSGWRFRGSYHRGAEAYRRALRAVPSSHLAFRGAGFARLTGLLGSDARTLRTGSSAGPHPAQFGAYPSLEADTLAFVPWPIKDFGNLALHAVPPNRAAALRRSGELLLGVVSGWVRAYPESPDAHEALALALEALGELGAVRQGHPSALSELRRARALAREGDQRLRLAIAQVRVLLKVGETARAKALADSTLRGWPRPESHDAQRLATLAVLTGRARQAVELLRTAVPDTRATTPEGHHEQLPRALTEAAQEVLVYHSLGMRPEGVAAEARLEERIGAWVPEDAREQARAALLNHPRRMAFTARAGGVPGAPLRTGDYVVQMQQFLMSGDTLKVRQLLEHVHRGRQDRRPGEVAIDYVLAEAEVHLALGEPELAAAELDRTLRGVDALSPRLLDRVNETAAVPRAMLLRAELAAARGDRADAEAWARQVDILWADADSPLRAVVRRLHSAVNAARPAGPWPARP